LDQVQPAVAHIGAYEYGTSYSSGGLQLIGGGLPTQQQRSPARNEGRTKGGSPSGRIGAERIRSNDAFARGSNQHNGIAKVGEKGALIEVVR
jgi:hypothetical protein